jgi:hypothetical protein
MDPRLAELYGTNQVDEGDLEKAAAAEFAEGLTEEGEMSLDGLTEDDLEALAQEVLSEDGAEMEEPAEEGEVAFTEEEQEKLAEADFVGRAMAHAYVAELNEIEKKANWESGGGHPNFPMGEDGTKGYMKDHKETKKPTLSRNSESTSGKGGRQRSAGAKDRLRRMRERHVAGRMTLKQKAQSAGRYAGVKGKAALEKLKGHGRAAGAHIKKYPGRYGAAAAGTIGALTLAHQAGKSKSASAMETLAEQRALEILEANGYDTTEPGEKTAGNQYDVLANVVEQRAVEMLAEAGYEFEAQE